MARIFKQAAEENVKELGEARQDFARFEKGPQDVKIMGLTIDDCDAPNDTWLKVNFVVAAVTAQTLEEEKKIKDDGSEATYYTAKDAEGQIVPSTKHMVFVPMGSVFYTGKSGKRTSFLWQQAVKFFAVNGFEVNELRDLQGVFGTDEEAVEYFTGKVFNADFGHRGKYIAEDGDVWRIYDVDEEPIKVANPDFVNEFTTDKKAKAAARINKIKIDEYGKYLNILDVAKAEGETEAAPVVDAADDFVDEVATAEAEAEAKPAPKPKPKPAAKKKAPAKAKAKEETPEVVEEYDIEIDEGSDWE